MASISSHTKTNTTFADDLERCSIVGDCVRQIIHHVFQRSSDILRHAIIRIAIPMMYLLLMAFSHVEMTEAQGKEYRSIKRINISSKKTSESQSNYNDYKKYAEISLIDFYNTILACIHDPADQTVLLRNYENNIASKPRFVADLLYAFPKDRFYTLDSYISNLFRQYGESLGNKTAMVQITPGTMVVKNVLKQDTGIMIQVNYEVKLIVDNTVKYKGKSEASIAYANPNYCYDYKIQSVLPMAFNDYLSSLYKAIDIPQITLLAKQAMKKGDYLTAKTNFEKLIENGKTDFLFDLAKLYSYGFGVTRNDKIAYMLLQRLDSTGTPRALGGMAYLLWYGINVKTDREGAYQYAQRAASKGDAAGHFFLGLYHVQKDQATHKDTLTAQSHFMTACRDYPNAYSQLAMISRANNDLTAYNHYLDLGISEGIVTAFRLKGFAYMFGEGVPKDIKKAEQLFRIAAENYQDYFAYWVWGYMYEYMEDMNKAIEYYKIGFSKGNPDSAKELFQYYSGMRDGDYHRLRITDSIRSTRAKSLIYLPTALEVDDDGRCAYRGMEIYRSELAKPDSAMAFVYAQKALDKGYQEANFDIAEMYYFGKGAKEDLNKAQSYYLAYINRKDIKEGTVFINGETSIDIYTLKPDGSNVWIMDNSIKRRYWDALFKLGYIYHINGDLKSALHYYNRSVRVQPNGAAFCNMGIIYNNPSNNSLYDREKAIDAYTRASKLGNKEATKQLRILTGQRT